MSWGSRSWSSGRFGKVFEWGTIIVIKIHFGGVPVEVLKHTQILIRFREAQVVMFECVDEATLQIVLIFSFLPMSPNLDLSLIRDIVRRCFWSVRLQGLYPLVLDLSRGVG